MKIRGMQIGVKQARMVLGLKGQEPSGYNRCIGGKLRATHPKDLQEAQANFKAAVPGCRGK